MALQVLERTLCSKMVTLYVVKIPKGQTSDYKNVSRCEDEKTITPSISRICNEDLMWSKFNSDSKAFLGNFLILF